MILDERNEFAVANTGGVAGAQATRELIGDVIDLGAAGLDIGTGEPLYLVVQVTTGFDSAAGDTDAAFELASDSVAAIAVDGTASIHASTALLGEEILVAGYRFVLQVPPEGSTPYERYLGVLIRRAGGEAITVGAVSAFLTRDVNAWKAYDAPGQV